jgi:hypothetical protein
VDLSQRSQLTGVARLEAMLEHTRTFLAARAVPGIEEAGPASYRRTVRVAGGHRVIELGGSDAAARRLAGSGEAAAAADAHLRGDPLLGPLVARRPGLRVPGTVDGGELAIRATACPSLTER